MKKRITAPAPHPPPAETKPALLAGAGVPAKKKSRAGRKKERMQISVRIDQAVMDLAYQTIERRKDDKLRITDLLERGLVLALREIETMQPVASQARLLLNDAGVDFQRRIVKLYALEHFPKARPLSVCEAKYRAITLEAVDSVDQWTDYQNALRAGALTEAAEA